MRERLRAAVACGLNGAGIQAQICQTGRWVSTGECDDPDLCVNGLEVTESCGSNGIGSQSQMCQGGQWAPPDDCGGPACAQRTPNALLKTDGVLLPLVDGFAWQHEGEILSLLDPDETTIWTTEIPPRQALRRV